MATTTTPRPGRTVRPVRVRRDEVSLLRDYRALSPLDAAYIRKLVRDWVTMTRATRRGR